MAARAPSPAAPGTPSKTGAFPASLRNELEAILAAPVLNALRRRVESEPWNEEVERATRPFHFALVPAEVWKGAKFERSFVTGLGSLWERAAIAIARELRGSGVKGYRYSGEIYSSQLRVIQEILGRLETGTAPDWETEIERVWAAAAGAKEECRVIVDVAVDVGSPERMFFEVKSPMPNSDQTKVSKEKILKLCAMEGAVCAYYALPFNPYPTRAEYGWGPPKRWFDMAADEVVMIGDEFWDVLGGPGTFQLLVAIADGVGDRLRDRIVREYLLA